MPSPRLKEIITALISHLHAFAGEVRLTHEEWAAGIAFLTDAGHITDEKRQEFIMLSDTLGLSMLVDLIDHRPDHGETESTVLGPFYLADAPWRGAGTSIARAQDGDPLHVSGQVRGEDGRSLSGAVIDVWQASAAGLYDVQDASQPENNLRGRIRADADGRYDFWTVRPVAYPIPDDGPAGRMLRALGRHPWRAPHIHFIVSADGYLPVTTHVFDADGEYLDSDTVFGVKPSLVRTLHRRDEPAPGALAEVDNHSTLYYDFVLRRAGGGGPPAR